MARKKKLKIGDIVRAYFVGASDVYRVIEVTDKNAWKLECVKSGTILPSVKWEQDKDKKSPLYIYEYVGHETISKSTKDINTIKNTLEKAELSAAIEIQKKFIDGEVRK